VKGYEEHPPHPGKSMVGKSSSTSALVGSGANLKGDTYLLAKLRPDALKRKHSYHP